MSSYFSPIEMFKQYNRFKVNFSFGFSLFIHALFPENSGWMSAHNTH